MDLNQMYGPPSWFSTWTVLFCVVWPFVTLALLRSRAESPVPIAAILVPMSIATSVMWVGFINLLRGVAIVGGDARISTAAGLSEALFTLSITLVPVAGIALGCLIRRHRAVANRASMGIFGALVLEVAVAVLFARWLTLSAAWIAIAGAASSLVIALCAAVHLYFVRRRPQVVAVPFGVPILAVLYVIMGLLVRHETRRYLDIVMNAWSTRPTIRAR